MIHVMLPVQYLRRAGAHLTAPHRRLMLAVLQAVVDDCQEPPHPGAERTARRAHEEAMAYVASTDRSWPFSFENLCEAVGLDPGFVRRELRTAGAPDASA